MYRPAGTLISHEESGGGIRESCLASKAILDSVPPRLSRGMV